jgi:hypothetical protein
MKISKRDLISVTMNFNLKDPIATYMLCSRSVKTKSFTADAEFRLKLPINTDYDHSLLMVGCECI